MIMKNQKDSFLRLIEAIIHGLHRKIIHYLH